MIMQLENYPPELLALLSAIEKPANVIREEVAQLLLKHWRGERLTKKDLETQLTTAESAAVLSIENKRPVRPDVIRQALTRRKTTAPGEKPMPEPSQTWGSGPTKRQVWTFNSLLDVKVRERRKKPGEADQQ